MEYRYSQQGRERRGEGRGYDEFFWTSSLLPSPLLLLTYLPSFMNLKMIFRCFAIYDSL